MIKERRLNRRLFTSNVDNMNILRILMRDKKSKL
jgi:hypothetical protein